MAAALFGTCAVAVVVMILFYVLCKGDGKHKIKQRKRGQPDEPIVFAMRNLKFPPMTGWPLYLMTCLLEWTTIPDPPTYLPQVLPSEKQKEYKPPDLEAHLRTPSKKKGFLLLTIPELVDAYRTGKTTPLQVTENALEAIQKSEKVALKLRAFVQFNKSDALMMAQESTKRYTEKKPLSIVDGVPVGIKEEFEVAGYHTRCGTAFLGKDPEEKDCSLVAKLRELGCVILGITNMHELGAGTTGDNPNRCDYVVETVNSKETGTLTFAPYLRPLMGAAILHGTPRNPYNLEHYTGGSSSGSACAVAAGICPVAIGSDGGGSIRIPSSLCGVVGVKATFGRITAHKLRALGGLTVSHAGPICNNVRDTALMYALLSGRDVDYFPGLIQPDHATLDGFENTKLSDITVGIDWSFAEFADVKVVEHFRKAVRYVEEHGATVCPIQIPELEESRVAHAITIGSEFSSGIQNAFPEDAPNLNPDNILVKHVVETFTAVDYLLAQKQRTRSMEFMKSVFSKVDCILTPGTSCTAPKIPEGAAKYGWSHATTKGKLMRHATLGNLTGIPAIVLPVGYDDNDLPISVQVMTAWWEEHVAFRVAHALESRVVRKEPELHYNTLNPSKSI